MSLLQQLNLGSSLGRRGGEKCHTIATRFNKRWNINEQSSCHCKSTSALQFHPDSSFFKWESFFSYCNMAEKAGSQML